MRRTKAEALETRQRILCAAEQIFYEKGVAETTLEDVARAAGVTRGAIYWHFANKTELLLALHDLVPLPQEDMTEEALTLDHVKQRCLDWLRVISTDERRQRIYAILLRCEYSDEMAGILQRQQALDEEAREMLCRAFANAQQRGHLAPGWSPDVASRCFMWMVKGLYFDWLRYGMKFDLVAEGEKCLAQLFGGFGACRT